MAKLFCYGDSNTCGYDPRDLFGGTYPPDQIWCSLLEKELGITVINGGENGRTLPLGTRAMEILDRQIGASQPDAVLVMLGTNDILQGRPAEKIGVLAQQLMVHLSERIQPCHLLLLAPPPIGLPEPSVLHLYHAVQMMYQKLAERMQIRFLNPAEWALPLAPDGVHLTEEGHRIFACALAKQLQKFDPPLL